MKHNQNKIKMEHHVIPEFIKLLKEIEKQQYIKRLIPGRIDRKQKKTSTMRFKVQYPTHTGIKCIMSKGSTAQELFVICAEEHIDEVIMFLHITSKGYLSSQK